MAQDQDDNTSPFSNSIDELCEYFARYDYSEELTVANHIRAAFSSQRPVDQELYDQLLREIGHCAAGSMICSMWWHMRAWGLSQGLAVPSPEEFPWRKK